MKTYNKIFASLIGCSLALGAVSCSDKNENEDYMPQEFQGNGVYFASNLPATFQVTEEAPTVQIPVNRGNASGALTVDITVETTAADTGVLPYTFASSVTFADGEKVGYLSVTGDLTQLEYDDAMQFELTIDPKYTTPYGLSTAIVSLVYPGPWTNLGYATYTDDFFEFTTTLPIEQNELNPNQYRVPNPLYTAEEVEAYDLDEYFVFEVVNAGETFNFDYFGTTVPFVAEQDGLVGYNPFYLFSDEVTEGPVDFYYIFPPLYKYPWDHNRVVGYQNVESNGVKLPGEIKLSPLVMELDYGYWYGDTSADDLISIIFPGYDPKDTSLEIAYGGMLSAPDNNNYALADVTLGSDLSSVKIGVAAGSDVSTISTEIENGTLSSVEVNTSGEYKVLFPSDAESGQYTLVALGYLDGEVATTAYVTFNYYASNYNPNEGWNSLGYVEYTDGYVCADYFLPYFNIYGTYEVEIQENEETPGVYRLVKPYGAAFPYNDEGDYDAFGNYYLIVDATVPNQVYVATCETSLLLEANPMTVTSVAGLFMEAGYPRDMVEAGANQQQWFDGNPWGTLENNVITFPPLALMANYGSDEYWYSANVALDYDKLDAWMANPQNVDPFMYNIDGSLYAPFKINLNTISAQPHTQSLSAAPSTRSANMHVKAKNGNRMKGIQKLSSKHTKKSSRPVRSELRR